MKKIFMFLSFAAASMFAYAEDVITVLPMQVTAGEGFDGSEMSYEAVTTVNLCNSDNYYGVQFDINVPAGMLVDFDTEGCSRAKFTKKGTKVTWCHTASVSESKSSEYPGYERYTIGVSDQVTGDAFVGNSGEDLLNMYYAIPTDLVDGVYPIYFTRIYFSDVDDNLISAPEGTVATSYMVVGNGKGTLVVDGQIPSFVNDELAKESAITSIDLTKCTATHGIFTYVDGRNVIAPSAEVKSDVAYFHAAGANVYSSVCLPFDAQVKNAYTLSGVEGDYATFAAVAPGVALAANTPAIVGGEISVEAQDVVLKGVQQETKTSGCYLKADKFLSVNGSAVIPALRGWWDVSSSVKGFVLDGETAITGLNADGAQQIYNVSGIKQAKAQRGVNIVNGKKVVVK